MKATLVILTVMAAVNGLFGMPDNAPRVLIVGNSLCERNNMLEIFQRILTLNHKELVIKADFVGGASIFENICHQIGADCNHDSPAYWIKGNKGYKAFRKYLNHYDYILFQGAKATDLYYPEIVKCASAITKKSQTKIILFQNYSGIIWNDSLRYSILKKQSEIFDKIKADRVKIMPIGDLFHYSMIQIPPFKIVLPDGHPTKAGTVLIALELFYAVYNKMPKLKQEDLSEFNIQDPDIKNCITIFETYHEK